MSDEGPGNGQPLAPQAPTTPSVPSVPPLPAVPVGRRHPLLTALMIIIGIVALLPGVCALFFMVAMPGGGGGALALLWLVCLAISAGGIALIVRASRG
jgi:hypothetical protein